MSPSKPARRHRRPTVNEGLIHFPLAITSRERTRATFSSETDCSSESGSSSLPHAQGAIERLPPLAVCSGIHLFGYCFPVASTSYGVCVDQHCWAIVCWGHQRQNLRRRKPARGPQQSRPMLASAARCALRQSNERPGPTQSGPPRHRHHDHHLEVAE